MLALRGAWGRYCVLAMLALSVLLAATPLVPTGIALAANEDEHGTESENATSKNLAKFAQRFTEVFEAHDREAAIELFYWEGVAETDRARILQLIDNDLARKLKRIALLPRGAAGQIPDRWIDDGVPMRNNLEVIGHLAAEFEDQNGNVGHSLHNLGVGGGVVYIVLARVESI